MTTAAPPEKTNAELAKGMELIAQVLESLGAKECLYVDAREAARRLAPTMPTGGIRWALDQIRIMTQTVDARSRKQHPVVLRIAEVAKKALALSAPAAAAPRMGDGRKDGQLTKFARDTLKHHEGHSCDVCELCRAYLAANDGPPREPTLEMLAAGARTWTDEDYGEHERAIYAAMIRAWWLSHTAPQEK